MPGKPRRGRGKYSPPIRKRKERLNRSVTPVRQPAITQTREPVPSTRELTPLVKAAIGRRYPYVGRELRTIAILASVLLVILIVLSRVLP